MPNFCQDSEDHLVVKCPSFGPDCVCSFSVRQYGDKKTTKCGECGKVVYLQECKKKTEVRFVGFFFVLEAVVTESAIGC